MLNKTIRFLVIGLIFVLILDPSDLIFRMKIPIFLLIYLFWFLSKTFPKSKIHLNKDLLFMMILFLTIPLFGFFSGLWQDTIVDYDFAVGIIKSFSFILLLPVIYDLSIPMLKNVNRISLLIIAITIPLYFVFLFSPQLFKPITAYIVDSKQVAIFALREYFGIQIIMIFYKTSSLLVFPCAYYLNKFYKEKRFIDFVIAAAAFFTLFLSGTRANILAAFVILVYFFYIHLYEKKHYIRLAICLMVLFAAIVYALGSLSGAKDESSDVKGGHLNGILAQISDPETLLIGKGIGSKYYSPGVKTNILQSELSYLEMIRMFGLPVTFLFLFLLLYPFFYLFRSFKAGNNKDIYIAYLAYLFIAGTNPLLINSTGMLVILSMYSVIGRRIDESK